MGGDAKSLYEEAIALSFEQYGLPATDALSYAANASNTPQAYTCLLYTSCFISTIVVYSLKTNYEVAKIVICKDNEEESKKY